MLKAPLGLHDRLDFLEVGASHPPRYPDFNEPEWIKAR